MNDRIKLSKVLKNKVNFNLFVVNKTSLPIIKKYSNQTVFNKFIHQIKMIYHHKITNYDHISLFYIMSVLILEGSKDVSNAMCNRLKPIIHDFNSKHRFSYKTLNKYAFANGLKLNLESAYSKRILVIYAHKYSYTLLTNNKNTLNRLNNQFMKLAYNHAIIGRLMALSTRHMDYKPDLPNTIWITIKYLLKYEDSSEHDEKSSDESALITLNTIRSADHI